MILIPIFYFLNGIISLTRGLIISNSIGVPLKVHFSIKKYYSFLTFRSATNRKSETKREKSRRLYKTITIADTCEWHSNKCPGVAKTIRFVMKTNIQPKNALKVVIEVGVPTVSFWRFPASFLLLTFVRVCFSHKRVATQ